MSRSENTAHKSTGQVFSAQGRTAPVRVRSAFGVRGGTVDGDATSVGRQRCVASNTVATFTRSAGHRTRARGTSSARAAAGGWRPVDRDTSVAAVTPSAYGVG